MGNSVEASKIGQQSNPPNEDLSNPLNKNKKADDEQEWIEFFKGNHDPNFGQLIGWSLTEIKAVYEKFRRLSQFPMMDRIIFSKVMPFTKRNSFFIFSHLTAKRKLMFAIFDFNSTMTISFPEWQIFLISFLQCIARLLQKEFPPKAKMEKIAKIIFIKADIAPYDNVLDFSELKDWMESATGLMELFQKYEPNFPIKERNALFYSFKPYSDSQSEVIFKHINLYGIADEIPDDIKEMIESSGRPGNQLKILEETYSRDSSRKSTMLPKTKTNETLVSPKNPSIDSPTKPSLLSGLISPKGSPKRSLILPQIRSGSIDESSTMQPKSFMSPLNKRTKSPPKDYTKEEILQRKRDIWLKAKSTKRNVLITNGKTISKSDVMNLKGYFDSIADGEDQLTLKSFVRSFSKNSNLQKVSASLFNFLDDKAHGFVTFPGLIKKLYPSLTKDEFEQLVRWSLEDELMLKAKSPKRFMDDSLKKLNSKKDIKPMYEVPREAVKKLKYIFDLYDEEKKGYVSLDNLRKKFSGVYSWKEIENKFQEFDRDRDGQLNLKEFIDVILPPDFYLDPVFLQGV